MQHTKNKIATSLCSVIEVYMTDCCDEPHAEEKCITYIKKALDYAPRNTEVHHLNASIQLCRCELALATESIKYAISIWIDLESTHPEWPTLSVRISQSKVRN